LFFGQSKWLMLLQYFISGHRGLNTAVITSY
jgi:hypothetical protein